MFILLPPAEGNFPESSNGISDMSDESIDELFAATFDCIRDSATNAIRKTCDFLGKLTSKWKI